jgi:hypothetical protein
MRIYLLLVAAFVVAGCGSVPERVSKRFSAPEPQERIWEVEEAKVFPAVQEALTRLRYQITRAAQAQGIVNAHSRLLPTETFGRADQYLFEIRMRALDGGATSMAAVLYEVSEGEMKAGATSTPLREHGRYASLFEMVEQVLREQEALK